MSFGDEVEGALGQGRVQGLRGQTAQEVAVAVDDARAELPLDHTAQRAVADTVHLQDGGALLDLVAVELFEVDEPRRREGLRVAVYAGDVLVLGHRPETGVRSLLGLPVDRVLVAQGVEHPPRRDAVGEVVEVREVHLAEGQGLVEGGAQFSSRVVGTAGTVGLVMRVDLLGEGFEGWLRGGRRTR